MIVCIIGSISGLSHQSGQSATNSQSQDGKSPEFKLATLYAGTYPSSSLVAQFSAVLDDLARKTTDDRETCAKAIYAGQTVLKKDGVSEDLLSYAQHIDDSIPANFHHGIDIQGTAAAYNTLRTPR
ncbi:MAG: hypothetical protein M3Y56_07010 [Armatimonadota bacterium]|nr:hypothetical protein [Armatimonadota bacterium]